MFAYAPARFIKRLLPAGMYFRIRGIGMAALTPFLFTWSSGHWRSCVASRAMDRHGRPQPWYTYPAIDFLSNQDLRGKRILEWGAGYSTLWWAARSLAVDAMESDPAWIERLRPLVPRNVTLWQVREDIADAQPTGLYDVIIVDGLDRARCAAHSLSLLASDGAIVVDDTEAHPETPPILELLHRAGLNRIDFYGFASNTFRISCTSIFFRERCFLLRNPRPPARSEIDRGRG